MTSSKNMYNKTITTIMILSVIPIIFGSYFIFDSEINDWIILLDQYFDENALMSRISVLAGAISLPVAATAYFIQRHLNDKNKRKRTSENLYIELSDASDALDYDNHKKDAKDVKLIDGTIARFMNRALNHDFYESYLFRTNQFTSS
jgi:hypothetical protein